MRESVFQRKALLLIALSGVLLAAPGCGGDGKATEEAAAQPSFTPEPVIVSIDVVEQAVPAAQQAPLPTPSPTPAATQVPFSYYAPTVNMTYEELVGSTDDMGKSDKELLKDGYPDPKTYYIIVDKQWQVTLVYRRIDDGTKNGKPDYDQPVRYMLCSSGNPNKEYGHDTTSGIWPIEPAKVRFYQFVNLEAAQYLTLIHSRTYFHSVLYKKSKDLSTLVKDSYDDLGKKASHACIRLTVPDARWMYYNIGYGTTCEIRDGDEKDAETAAIRAQLILPASKANVRLKASEYVWTDNWKIEDVAHELPYKHMEPRKPDLGDGAADDAAEAAGTATPAPGGGAIAGGGATVTEPPAVTPDTSGGGSDSTGGTTDGGSTGPVFDPDSISF